MAASSFYPPNPKDVPEDYAEPSAQYKTKTVMVLLAIGLFFLLYFGLMLFCTFYVLWAVFLCPPRPPWLKPIAVMLIFPAGILFVYMFKNLFKFERAQKEFLIEIYEDEHPKLFAFIGRVCDDVGASAPKHVYVDYNVNAAARPDTTSMLHLFIPTGQSLIIGLGLVNVLNLTEFKSVIAHEFGHFTQKKGMKIGTFCIAALGIFMHIVYGEDIFDRFVLRWSQQHPIIAWPAYLGRGILWLLRKTLSLVWYAVAYFFFAHRREMEFHADQVAVALGGSDAVVHSLYRMNFGNECFNQSVEDLRVAMSHHLYTSDLFYHQSAAAGFLRARKKDANLGEPPALPDDPNETTQVFNEEDGPEIDEM